MNNTFAKLFSVDGDSHQLLICRIHDKESDLTHLHLITEIDNVRLDAKFDFQRVDQEEVVQTCLEQMDQDRAEQLFILVLELFGRNDND